MLDSLRRGQRWLTAFLVAVIGLVFAAFIGLGGPLSGPTGAAPGVAIQVGELTYDQSEYLRGRSRLEEIVREQAGDQFDARAMGPLLDSQAVQQIVDGAILAESGRRLGLRVSKGEVQRAIREGGGFVGEDGRFDVEQFEGWVEWNYGTQRAFLETMRRDLLRAKTVRLVYDQVSVSDAEARAAARQALEEVRIAYVALDRERLPADQEVSDEEIQAYAAANEEALRAQYEESRSIFTEPARFEARHILFAVDRDAPDDVAAEARQRAGAALERLRAGGDFAALAEELSDDARTASEGGSLGTLQRGDVAPELEEAGFAQEIGAVSEPVRTDKGFHLLLVESRQEERIQPYEEAVDSLARAGAEEEKATARATELVDALVAAVEAGESLEDAARARDLDLGRTGLVRRRPDGFVPGLGASQELLYEAFALESEGDSSPRPFEVGSKLVLIQLLERKAPAEEELEAATTAQRDTLLASKRNQALRAWIDTRREELEADGELFVDPNLFSG